MNLEKVYAHIDANVDSHIGKVQELLRQPSISAENRGVRECAQLLERYFQELGCRTTEIVQTDGNPVVYGEYDAGAKKTVIVYMMYDTQPVAGEDWISSPLEANLVDIPPFGKCIVARGAINTKGPLRAFLNAMESIKAAGEELPVNLKVVAEGEEELGSVHLPQFVQRYKEKLKDADAVFFPGAAQDQKGTVRMSLGYKGIVYFELECSGNLWRRGPMEYDVHSSNKAWVDSPVWRMIQALSTMTSKDGNRILIDRWYENVKPPSKEDMELVNKLAKTFDEETVKEMIKVERFIDNLHGKKLLLKYLYATTLNVDGIWGGYTGPGTKTVLPYKVTVKMDVRLVPKQKPSEILPRIRKHLDKMGYRDIFIRRLESGYSWAKTSVKGPLAQAAIQTYRSFGYEPEVWPHMGGSAPLYLFNQGPLYLPFVGGGLGHGGKAHSPNEYFVVEGNKRVGGLAKCEKSYVAVLDAYSKIEERPKGTKKRR